MLQTVQNDRSVRALLAGAIDCDVHPRAPHTRDLIPFLGKHWVDTVSFRDVVMRELTSYPPNAPLTRRPDWGVKGESGATLEGIQSQLLDHWGLRAAILTPLFSGGFLHDPVLGNALCAAHNDWIAREWLDKDDRLRGSIVVNLGRPEVAADEIDRTAADQRFVQIILPVQGEIPYGRTIYRPIFEAAVRNGLPIALHAGSMFRNAPSTSGYYSTFTEDYSQHISAFTAQVANFIAENVFNEYPELKLVLIESGVSWMPPFMWRFSKDWRGVRNEVPWIDRQPSDVMRDHVFLTATPFDAPPENVGKIVNHLGNPGMLLFASDHPHWHYDGDNAVPEGMPEEHLAGLLSGNALRAYPRLGGLK